MLLANHKLNFRIFGAWDHFETVWFWACFIMFYTCEVVGTFCFSCLHGLKRNCIVGEESFIRVNLVPIL